MLEIGKANPVRFKVGVNGTSATPAVRLVITGNCDMGFPAVQEGDGWMSEVYIPGTMQPGKYPFRVEVILNNRLFTPIKQDVELAHSPVMYAAPIAKPVPEPMPDIEFVAPQEVSPTVESPTPVRKPEIAALFKQIITQEEVAPPPPKPAPKPKKSPAAPPAHPVKVPENPLPREKIKIPPQPQLSKLVTEVKRPVMKRPVSTAKTLTKPIARITMMDIANESHKRFDDVLGESHSYSPPTKPTVSLNLSSSTPMKLKKGKVVYE